MSASTLAGDQRYHVGASGSVRIGIQMRIGVEFNGVMNWCGPTCHRHSEVDKTTGTTMRQMKNERVLLTP